MSPFAAVAAFKHWMTAQERIRAFAKFTCAHCERNARCGRPPSDDCIERLAQIEQGDGWRFRTTSQLRRQRLIV